MRVFIVDDERLARAELRRMLDAFDRITIVGEAANADEAVEALEREEVDLLFLDIRMPGGSGFDVLERLDRVPEVVFTTAFDEYAVRAFEEDALDYLLKPIAPERLAEAVERAARRRTPSRLGSHDTLGEDDRVFVRDGRRCWLLRLGDVHLLESEGNHTRLCTDRARPLVPRSLKNLDQQLDPRVFFRANRRQTLNLRSVVRIRTAEGGGLVAELDGGVEVSISRRRANLFRERLEL